MLAIILYKILVRKEGEEKKVTTQKQDLQYPVMSLPLVSHLTSLAFNSIT